MKRFFVSLFFVGTATVLIGGTAGYFYARAHLNELPRLLASTLKGQSIDLKYASAEMPPAGLSFTLKKVEISGPPLPVRVSADSLKLSLELAASWPMLRFNVAAISPTIATTPAVTAAPSQKSAPMNESAVEIASYVLGLTQFRASVTNLAFPEQEVGHLNATITLAHVGLGEEGLVKADLSHDLLLGEMGKQPWLAGLRWKGDSTYEQGAVQSRDQTLALGPFVLQIDGRYDLKSGKWTATAIIPRTTLGAGSSILNAQAQWLKSISGEVELKIDAQGLGSDPGSINAEGKILAHGLDMKVDHDLARGDLKADIDADISKAKALTLKLKASADLTGAGVTFKDTFTKSRGVPLTLEVDLDGHDGKFTLAKANARLNNLSASAAGSVSLGENLKGRPQGDLKIAIGQTSLEGWEQFFPKYSSLKTQGTIEGSLAYQGPLDDWKSADLDLHLKAQNVRLPVLKAWIPKPELQIEGIVAAQSDTNVAYSRGVLKQLATETRLDLREAAVKYGELFQKKSNVPLYADLSVVSTPTRADIRRGEIGAGTLRGHLRGSIDNFTSPVVRLAFDTQTLSLPEVLALSPASNSKKFTQLSGNFGVKGEVSGPLVPGPDVKGRLDLSHLAGTYTGEGTSHPIQLLDATGPVLFTKDSVSTKKLAVKFAHSDAQIDLDVQSFQHPQIRFAMKGNHLSLADFSEPQAKDKAAPAGLVAVPVQGTEKTSEQDFRQNPFLKSMKIDGALAFRDADLGWAKAEAVSVKIAYDKLWLKVDPLSMKVLGGTLATATEWNGRAPVPVTKLTLKAEHVDANQFLSSWSDKARDLVFGKLNANAAMQFEGMTASAIQQSAAGSGTYALVDGVVKPLRLVQGPLEQLKKLPLIGGQIGNANVDEKLNQLSGSFKLEKGKILLSNVNVRSPYIDATAHDVSLDYNQNVQAQLEWSPKPALVPAKYLDALRDPAGNASLPLKVSGPLRSPAVTLDQSVAESRVKAYGMRKLNEEKNRAVSQVKSRVEDQLKQQVQKGLGGLKNIFK